jgi:hypothetical protein
MINKDSNYNIEDADEFFIQLLDKLDEVKDDSVAAIEVLVAAKKWTSQPNFTTLSQDICERVIDFAHYFIDSLSISKSKRWKGPKFLDLVLHILSKCIQKSKSLDNFKKSQGLFDLLKDLLYKFNTDNTSIERKLFK